MNELLLATGSSSAVNLSAFVTEVGGQISKVFEYVGDAIGVVMSNGILLIGAVFYVARKVIGLFRGLLRSTT